MNKKIIRSIEKSSQVKHKIFHLTDGLETERLTYKPKPTSWNILQVITHLRDAEAGAIRYMGKKLQGIEGLEDSGLKPSINSTLLLMSLYLPLKFKAPQVVSNPDVKLDYDALKEDYLGLDDQLKVLVGSLPDNHMNKAIFKHPIAGRLNILQTLKFQRAHVIHHIRQIREILSKSS